MFSSADVADGRVKLMVSLDDAEPPFVVPSQRLIHPSTVMFEVLVMFSVPVVPVAIEGIVTVPAPPDAYVTPTLPLWVVGSVAFSVPGRTASEPAANVERRNLVHDSREVGCVFIFVMSVVIEQIWI